MAFAQGTNVDTSTLVPTGALLPFGGAVAPAGFLLCNGAAVSRADYADLFAVVGTAFGVGDGVTTFNLPDLRGRFPLGQAAAGTGSVLGGTGGAIDHAHTGPSHTHGAGTLAGDAVGDHTHTGPSHTHTFSDGFTTTTQPDHDHVLSTTTTSDGGHAHTYSDTTSGPSGTLWYASGTQRQAAGASHTHTTSGSTSADGGHLHSVGPVAVSANGSHSHSGSVSGTTGADGTGATGSDGGHGHTVSGATGADGTGATGAANPPFQAVTFIIKT